MTRDLWDKQDRHKGDRARLFTALAAVIPAQKVLYPGSYVDLGPSFAYPDVTYMDADRRAKRFFDDVAGVRAILDEEGAPAGTAFRFIHADYTALDLPERSFDLLVSLFAGLVSDHCTGFLRIGGTLLASASHGDAALARLDRRYVLTGIVDPEGTGYRVETEAPERYMIPRRAGDITADAIRANGKGVPYTRTPFAYLFTRVA